MLAKTCIFGILLLLSTPVLASTLPTWHATGSHQDAMVLVPPSDDPVTLRIVDAQQQVMLMLTLDATQGVKERIDFTWIPTGHYVLEVQFEQQTFYKTLLVQGDRVQTPNDTQHFRTATRFDL